MMPGMRNKPVKLVMLGLEILLLVVQLQLLIEIHSISADNGAVARAPCSYEAAGNDTANGTACRSAALTAYSNAFAGSYDPGLSFAAGPNCLW